MAPSATKLEDALLQGTYDIYRVEPDATTVNKVRKHVEEELGLEDGFFSSGQWKSKSKTLIKERVGKLFDGWVPETETESKPNFGTKRCTFDTESPESKPKRQKRAPKAKKPVKKESELSELSQEEKPQKRKRKAAAGRKSKAVDSDDEDDFKSEASTPPQKVKVKNISNAGEVKGDPSEVKVKVKESDAEEEDAPVKKQEASSDEEKPATKDETEDEVQVKVSTIMEPTATAVDEEDEYSDVIDEPPKPKRKRKSKGDTSGKKSRAKSHDDTEDEVKVETKSADTINAVNEEEEYSDVIDELPKPKRKRKSKGEASSKPAKTPKAAAKKASEPEDANEAEIKKLQSQLIKCGIRKLWHNELKTYGDNSRAKIRHLKKMLTDVGMDGRFSEAKAREIKEMRELAAEAEAAQEMNALWGTGGPGRASRSKSKTVKEVVKDESEDGGEDGEEEDSGQEVSSFAARRRRAQAELAFLGDDSDSE
ncbi:Fc.00g016350.m01.CDS01 [Cosmosporella sp. VM-42]